VTGQTYVTSVSEPPRLNLLRLEEELSAIHLRLARVYVENMHYRDVLARFDRPDTFFYLDPPYYGCENYYGKPKEELLKEGGGRRRGGALYGEGRRRGRPPSTPYRTL
jgi:hypothetical protein